MPPIYSGSTSLWYSLYTLSAPYLSSFFFRMSVRATIPIASRK